MDDWLYYDVTHRDHVYCNPISGEGVRALERVLGLGPGVRVLDIACGHAEMLVGFTERHGITGVGVDASPYAFPRAERRVAERAPDVTLIHGRGEDYRPASGETFDVSMCIGASWIWGGFEGTLRALTGFTRPGGLVVSGEPYWRNEPSPEYLEVGELGADDIHDLPACLEVATRLGLRPVWARRSTDAEWDRYVLDQMTAFDRFERANPDHPGLDELRARHRRDQDNYLRWECRDLGFALWVFRTPAG